MNKIEQLAKLDARAVFLHNELENNAEIQNLLLLREEISSPKYKENMWIKLNSDIAARYKELHESGVSDYDALCIIPSEFDKKIDEIVNYPLRLSLEEQKNCDEIQRKIDEHPIVSEFSSVVKQRNELRREIKKEINNAPIV
jgi:hypothetical protein